jgi:hypothetical protein
LANEPGTYVFVMTTESSSLRLRHFIFSNEEFQKLPEPEQLFFIRAALISDDLRHLHHLMLYARVALKHQKNDIERMLGLHQLVFALRIYYGTLNEAWEAVRCGWFGTKLSQKMDAVLSDEGKNALDALKRYFDPGDTLTQTIRHEFAFHFKDEPIKEVLKHKLPAKYDGFVTGDDLANIFYMFAENALFHAILLRAGMTDVKDPEQIRKFVRKFFREALHVSDHFTAFFNAAMVKIVESMNRKIEKFSVSKVTDFSKLSPILFVDTESIRELGDDQPR